MVLYNLNFLPQKIKLRYLAKKIKVYKSLILFLWLICLLLFIAFVYIKNDYNKIASNSLLTSNYISKTTKANNLKADKNAAILSLNKYLSNLDDKLSCKSIVIHDNYIDMELIVESKNYYYEIVNYVENTMGYNVLNLSPLHNDNEALNFKLLIEVK